MTQFFKLRLLNWFSNIVNLTAIFVYFCTLLLRPLKNWEMAACHPWCSFLNHHRKSHIDWETFLYFSISAVEKKKRTFGGKKTCIFASPTPPRPSIIKVKLFRILYKKLGCIPKELAHSESLVRVKSERTFDLKPRLECLVFQKSWKIKNFWMSVMYVEKWLNWRKRPLWPQDGPHLNGLRMDLNGLGHVFSVRKVHEK